MFSKKQFKLMYDLACDYKFKLESEYHKAKYIDNQHVSPDYVDKFYNEHLEISLLITQLEKELKHG